jgi:lipopolysaccharide kinase (Kdo/WaaP) family protein
MLIHGAQMEVAPDLRAAFDGLPRPRDVIAKWGAKPASGGMRSVVREVALPQVRFFLKSYGYSGLWRLRTVFIPARAGREFRNLKRMAALGFRVPEPLAWGQERTLGFVGVSFVATRAIENAVDLRTLIDRPGASPLPPPPERRRLIEEFARTLRRAHDERFFIHTLRAKNLLLGREGARWVLHVIDVPFAGIGRYRLFPGWGRVRDVAVLMKWARQLLSRTERMRFARVYGADPALLKKAQAYQERHYP